jgi:glucosyl-3-phosphoglycerate synthase
MVRSCSLDQVEGTRVRTDTTGSSGEPAAWFNRRTSDIDDWSLERLVAAKSGQRIAVVLPALDEEKTIGEIVAAVRDDLTKSSAALVDEIIVADSGSTDDTAAIAADNGARVVRPGGVLPDIGSRRGKGEAMWRGLAATDADIVAYVDADLESFDSRFVLGLVGPLLDDPAVQLVKASYARPPIDPAVPSLGGGRVTELTARPLLNAFWPELGGVLQPLSGEYAARASLLRRLPFRCGYGVDIGLLIDAYQEVGLEGLAQVDLHRRWHQHSDLTSLGRMSAEILQTVVDRLVADGRVPAETELATTLWQPERLDRGVTISAHEVDTQQRPALASL